MSEQVQSGDALASPWTANDATFGARLALIRQRMAWGNVKEAALICGIPVQSWRTWERDGASPRDYLRVCERIAQASGCDYGWLVDRRPSGSSQATVGKLGPKLALLAGGGASFASTIPMLHTAPALSCDRG